MLRGSRQKGNDPGSGRGQSGIPPPGEGRSNTKHVESLAQGSAVVQRSGSGGCDAIERGPRPSYAALPLLRAPLCDLLRL